MDCCCVTDAAASSSKAGHCNHNQPVPVGAGSAAAAAAVAAAYSDTPLLWEASRGWPARLGSDGVRLLLAPCSRARKVKQPTSQTVDIHQCCDLSYQQHTISASGLCGYDCRQMHYIHYMHNHP